MQKTHGAGISCMQRSARVASLFFIYLAKTVPKISRIIQRRYSRNNKDHASVRLKKKRFFFLGVYPRDCFIQSTPIHKLPCFRFSTFFAKTQKNATVRIFMKKVAIEVYIYIDIKSDPVRCAECYASWNVYCDTCRCAWARVSSLIYRVRWYYTFFCRFKRAFRHIRWSHVSF